MSINKTIRAADLDSRRTFLTGMARSMLGVGAAATFGPDLVAGSLNGRLLPQGPQGKGKTRAEQTRAANEKRVVLGKASAKRMAAATRRICSAAKERGSPR